jgi:hypothetical protein
MGHDRMRMHAVAGSIAPFAAASPTERTELFGIHKE